MDQSSWNTPKPSDTDYKKPDEKNYKNGSFSEVYNKNGLEIILNLTLVPVFKLSYKGSITFKSSFPL